MSDKVTLEATQSAPAAEPVGAAPAAKRTHNYWQTFAPFAIFLALFAVVAVLQPNFLGGGGMTILASQAAPILLVALGQAMVLHVGSLDLSNAAKALLSAVLAAILLGRLGVVAPLVCLIIVTLVGVANGLLFAYTQVPSFALTLGTLGILQAASLVLTDATTVYVTANSGVVTWMYESALALLRSAFWVAVVAAVALWAMLRFTPLGMGMTAVGLNETGAIFAGLRTRWLKVTAFGLSGLMAGLAGLTVIAQAGAASSFGLGSDLLLPGIAAALVGGTAITGGSTNPVNVIFGALIVALLPIGAAAVGIPPQAQSLAYGLIIILAVALTISRSRAGVVK